MQEKRKEKRISSILPITVQANSQSIQCVSTNLSRSGVGFLSHKIINPGKCVLGIGKDSMSGTILYRKSQGSGIVQEKEKVYQYGVKLSATLTSAQLDQLVLQSRMPSKGRV